MSEETVSKSEGTSWYQMPVTDVMKALETGDTGLNSSEAKARLKKYGYNELKFKRRGALLRFLTQFNSPLLYILMVSAVVTAVMGMWVDASVIILVVLGNTVIGFVQEGKAEASLEALTRMMVLECSVIRDGHTQQIKARELVPGDIVVLAEGGRVPADLRLFYARNLYADEAALTGESLPADKNVEPIRTPDLSPADQICMAFSSTFVTRGSGKGVAVATAEQSEIGKIAKMVEEANLKTETPLMRQMNAFTKVMVIAILALSAVTLAVSATIGGLDMLYSFMAAVSFAVAAVPEGLPAIMTVALAFGARAMASRHALIRRLPAVETLGSANVICSDKTGTLTKNEMTVVRLYCGGKDYGVTGVGYEPTGEFSQDGRAIDPMADIDLALTLKAGLLCNDASLRQDEDGYRMLGDPTEGALVVSAMKAGIDTERLPRIDELPFESHEQYMATLHRERDQNILFVKGSPERVTKMCHSQLAGGSSQPVQARMILDEAEAMAREALRVLALAYRHVPADKTSISRADLEGMVFLGLQGMIDPPREEAIDAVAKCRKAGIRVVMITGDHARTAQAVAKKLGIGDGGEVLTG
ncbi:MAG: HAD-IC family P-type ATPase, partial [Chloroflexi bacterium]|nr:HAD-IC family P-type ATPase [Chloroflexota bacterium]